MATLFIADLHLHTEEPAITAGFLHFLDGVAREADALYILGDLFEAWIGDDDPNPLHQRVADAIRALVDSGVPCYFIHGNRDFLLGRRFARESGMQLLPEEQVLDLYGRRVLIMHGDTQIARDAGLYERAQRGSYLAVQRFRVVIAYPGFKEIAQNVKGVRFTRGTG